MTQLRSVTCHMGSHSVTYPTQVNTPRLIPEIYILVLFGVACLFFFGGGYTLPSNCPTSGIDASEWSGNHGTGHSPTEICFGAHHQRFWKQFGQNTHGAILLLSPRKPCIMQDCNVVFQTLEEQF